MNHIPEGSMNTIYLAPYTLPEGEKSFTYEHLLGRRLLAFALKDGFRLEVDQVWLDAFIRTEKGGKPFIFGLPHVHYNISHCVGMVALALSDRPVGVDVEKVRPMRDALVRRVLTEEEQSFLYKTASCEEARSEWFTRFWTLKESYLKYTGEGIAASLTSVSFRFHTEEAENEPPKNLCVTCSDPSVTMFQTDLPGHIILSACTGSKEPFSLRSVSLP
jgi:4'-phosphopantetheinyl transferase